MISSKETSPKSCAITDDVERLVMISDKTFSYLLDQEVSKMKKKEMFEQR